MYLCYVGGLLLLRLIPMRHQDKILENRETIIVITAVLLHLG